MPLAVPSVFRSKHSRIETIPDSQLSELLLRSKLRHTRQVSPVRCTVLFLLQFVHIAVTNSSHPELVITRKQLPELIRLCLR